MREEVKKKEFDWHIGSNNRLTQCLALLYRIYFIMTCCLHVCEFIFYYYFFVPLGLCSVAFFFIFIAGEKL